MDATTYAAMRLAEHRFADLERENRRRVAHAERHAAVAERRAAGIAEGERRTTRGTTAAETAPTSEAPARTAATGLALAGPSS